jgi:hypothetical protein
MRVDYYGTAVLAFDNMQNKGLKEQLIGPNMSCVVCASRSYINFLWCFTEWYRSNLV